MEKARTLLICSCEQTIALDAEAIARGCSGDVKQADQLCRRQLDLFKSVLPTGADITISCTQEAPLFGEVAEEFQAADRVTFANIRERAGWSKDAHAAGPKMAALLAAAAEPASPVTLVSMASEGVALVYGSDETAIEAAKTLAEHLDVTVLLRRPSGIAPPQLTEFPVLKGTIAAATGHLGAFELIVDDYALPSPSSRQVLRFEESRSGATSRCDIGIDLSGGTPLFPAHELRSGY